MKMTANNTKKRNHASFSKNNMMVSLQEKTEEVNGDLELHAVEAEALLGGPRGPLVRRLPQRPVPWGSGGSPSCGGDKQRAMSTKVVVCIYYSSVYEGKNEGKCGGKKIGHALIITKV